MKLKILALTILLALAGCTTPEVEAPAARTEPVESEPEPTLVPKVGFELETRNETVQVMLDLQQEYLASFKVDNATILEATYSKGQQVANVPLGFGYAFLEVVLDDGTNSHNASAQVARLSEATLAVHFNGYPGGTDRQETIWFNIDAPYSASFYEGTNVDHPAYGNVHDFMVEWANQTAVKFEYAFSNGLGYTVSTIDGIGSPVSAVPGDPSENLYWLYTIDGESAELGISAQEMTPGVTVAWCLGGCR